MPNTPPPSTFDSTTPEPIPLTPAAPAEPQHRTARQIFVRGLAITLPSILTLVIVLWLGRLVYDYIISPVATLVRFTAAQAVDRSVPVGTLSRFEALPPLDYVSGPYLLRPAYKAELEQWRVREIASGRLGEDEAIPVRRLLPRNEPQAIDDVYVPIGNRGVPYRDWFQFGREFPGRTATSATGVYMDLVTVRYFGSTFLLSVLAVAIALLAIYFVGRLVRIRLGAYLVAKVETQILGRLPIISNVYGSVKQVTDFVFSERQVSYNRVVALEYPRRGIWSVGFVTGDGMRQACDAAGEPLVNVLIPTSPMPVTGYTMSVPRSQVVDLDITFDQAFQFIISCGVLVAPQQQRLLTDELARRDAARPRDREPASAGS